jgi:DUF2934 family protein
MLFIHQQIQSFLNLGGCKEYSLMAKPKFPKKSNDVKETISATSSPVRGSDTNIGTADGLAAATVAETKKTETRKTARKPEIVKSEPRANLVPINLEDEIRRFAYLLSEHRGFEPGHEAEDWLAAEREVRQRYHQQSA